MFFFRTNQISTLYRLYLVCTIDASVHNTGFLSLLGVVFLGVTTTILLAVPEEPDQNPADESSVLVTYQNVICVSCLPAVRTLLLCLLTLKVYDLRFSLTSCLSQLKLYCFNSIFKNLV